MKQNSGKIFLFELCSFDLMFSQNESEFLKSQWVCRLASVSSSEGWPHNVPVGYAFDGQQFYLTSEPDARKVKNIQRNNKVCLIIDVPQKPRKAIMVQGIASLAEHGEEFNRINDLISQLKGWKKWEEGAQVMIQVEPKKKVSWGLEV